MNNELDKYYELLGVAPGTSGQELKDAYRDLAKVWHPDRFSHDPRLQQKAQEKLKEINEAYEQLTSRKAGRRTRHAHAPDKPDVYAKPEAHTAAPVSPKRTRLILTTAFVFCAVFVAALSSLVSQSARTLPERTTHAEAGEETQPPDKMQQPESGARIAAGQPARNKEQTSRRPSSEATSDSDAGRGASASGLRPMPTVTVTLDASNGLLATRDCPTVSRMTYPAGDEPRQYCTIRHKPKAGAQDSRLKSIGKRLAAPFK